MRLAHLHISRLIPYTYASQLQEILIQRHFLHKDTLRSDPSNTLSPPDPTVLTFSTLPTYTVGRRYLPSLTSPSTDQNPNHKYTLTHSQIAHLTHQNLAAFHPSPRGGDLTYHGPGQLTAYAILNLRTHHLTPRAYIRLLESSVINSCTLLGVPNTHTTSDPGVWLSESSTRPERKICAVGVQIRRGVVGHGVGFNVVDQPMDGRYVGEDGMEQQGSLSWGFGRIVACGLEGKGVTWLAREGMREETGVVEVGRVFVRELARGLGLDEVYEIGEEEVADVSG